MTTATKNLDCSCISVTPRTVDWQALGYGEGWELHHGFGQQECQGCKGTGILHVHCEGCQGKGHFQLEECPDCLGEPDSDEECVDCDGTGRRESGDPDAGIPTMNYVYSLEGCSIPSNASYLLRHLPLTIVEIDDDPYLALTGGGMDLSWEICEGYVLLGIYPPAHFCELPRMGGRGESQKDENLLRYCRESLKIHRDRATHTLSRFDDQWGPVKDPLTLEDHLYEAAMKGDRGALAALRDYYQEQLGR